MAKFYDYLSEGPIVATASQQLSWSHFMELIKVGDCAKRAGLCALLPIIKGCFRYTTRYARPS